jgi:hypothetical protein
MHGKRSKTHYYLNLISAVILVVGLGSATMIYILSPAESDGTQDYTIVGGTMYPKVPSKSYERNLELYGGRWLVISNDFMRWFEGLWYGKDLGITIAWISIVTAGGIFFFNNYVSFEDEDEAGDGKP